MKTMLLMIVTIAFAVSADAQIRGTDQIRRDSLNRQYERMDPYVPDSPTFNRNPVPTTDTPPSHLNQNRLDNSKDIINQPAKP